MQKEVQCIEHGPLRFLSNHQTLMQVAANLRRSLPEDLPPLPETDIWVGAHRFGRTTRTPGRKLIVLQTEQVKYLHGHKINRKLRLSKLLRIMLHADLVVDWSPAQRSVYGLLPRLMPRRFLFGPYVFPTVCPPRSGGEGIVSHGAIDERRARIVARHPEIDLRHNVSHSDAMKEIAGAAAVANLHRLEGVYTEVPRMLMALQSGKPVVSEPLAPPFDEAYLPLGATLDPQTLDAAYASLCDVARAYPIMAMFDRLGGKA